MRGSDTDFLIMLRKKLVHDYENLQTGILLIYPETWTVGALFRELYKILINTLFYICLIFKNKYVENNYK